ncbi:MAG TPA: hypothetical protein VJ818_08245 [Actinomycetota bacterium]|nr:hypothetical protein [Actinomycetota bacterium]
MKGKLQAARGADRIILIAGLVFFVDSFLPWYGVGFRALGIRLGGINISGWSSGGLAVLAILFAIAATVFAGARVVGAKLDLGEIKDGLVYIVLGGGAFLFALLRFLTAVHFTKYGLWIAIVAGAFLAYGGWMKLKAENK